MNESDNHYIIRDFSFYLQKQCIASIQESVIWLFSFFPDDLVPSLYQQVSTLMPTYTMRVYNSIFMSQTAPQFSFPELSIARLRGAVRLMSNNCYSHNHALIIATHYPTALLDVEKRYLG